MGHLTANNLLSGCQHGFVSGRSCTTNLLSTLETWVFMTNVGSSVDAIYLDLTKGFDSVPHKQLLKKVKALGTDGDTPKDKRSFRWHTSVSFHGSVSDYGKKQHTSGQCCQSHLIHGFH